MRRAKTAETIREPRGWLVCAPGYPGAVILKPWARSAGGAIFAWWHLHASSDGEALDDCGDGEAPRAILTRKDGTRVIVHAMKWEG